MKFNNFFVLLFCLVTWTVFSQDRFQVKGSVRHKATYDAIAKVEVSSSGGGFTTTNSMGDYKIMVRIDDELVFRSPDFETVRYTITSKEDVDVLVEGDVVFKSKTANKAKPHNVMHQQYLDSSITFKKIDINKSLEYIAQSIKVLGKRRDREKLAKSYHALGDVYDFYKQYDLAITNYKSALKESNSIETEIALGKAYNSSKLYKEAKVLFLRLEKKRLSTYEAVVIKEGLGDALKGEALLAPALKAYQEGLSVAKKGLITPKITDLNSKIADAYALQSNVSEAENYYDNSLKLAKKENRKRAVEQKEKVADFYNQNNSYDKEIELRIESLADVEDLEEEPKNKDSKLGLVTESAITSQRINYKIANAFIAQDKYSEAIPYLEKSIVAADNDDDIIVEKDARRKLSEVYETVGDFTKALESYKSYTSLVDTLYVRKEQEISRAGRFNRNIAEQQNRIVSLEKDRELSESKYALDATSKELSSETGKRQQFIIYALIFGMLMFGLIAFLFYRNNKQQRIANNVLALKSLRSQMNPHFIFNALNSVNNFIAKSDERSANRYLSNFSTLMRSVLENSEEDFIPLSKEVELLQLYTKLEHSRFVEKFDYEVLISKSIALEEFKIPPMLLQPYIENAIWHGLRYKEEKGFLTINISDVDAETLKISIEDNGIGRERSAALKTKNQMRQKSKGMGNIKKRIAILNEMYSNTVDVFITDLYKDGSGTKVELLLRKNKV